MKTINLNEESLREYIKNILLESNTPFGLNVKGDLTIDDIKSGVPLYHRPKGGDDVLKSLFTYGFSREFTNTNGGNMYGPGVYTVYNLRSSQTHATGYGKNIIKAYLLGGYKDFLIFNPDMADAVFKNKSDIKDQLREYLPQKLAEDVIKHVNLYYTKGMRSSVLAKRFCDYIGKRLNGTRVRGFVFTGGHDGDVCVVRDFSSIIPYAVSKDNGRTWTTMITDGLIKRAGLSVDTDFKYKHAKDEQDKKMFDDVSDRAINGFVMVHKDNQINFINVKTDKLISNTWFDIATNFNEDGYAEVNVNGETFELYNDNGTIFIADEDGFPIEELK